MALDDTPESALDPLTTLPVLLPVEQLPVTFFDHVVLAVRRDTGQIYLAIRDLCDAITLQLSPQLRRIRNHAVLREGLARFQVTTSGGAQVQAFLELELVPTWLLMVNAARSTDLVRSRLTHLQRYIVREVYTAFARLAGFPEESSRQIEDLADLRRLDLAMMTLAERQQAIEESQDKARQVWRNLTAQVRDIVARVSAVEQKVGGIITRAQRGYIYQLVQRWGEAKVQHDPRLTRAAAFAACWTVIKTKYQVARYEDLPASKYADCVTFIRQSYRQLTGTDLDLPEQTELDIE